MSALVRPVTDSGCHMSTSSQFCGSTNRKASYRAGAVPDDNCVAPEVKAARSAGVHIKGQIFAQAY